MPQILGFMSDTGWLSEAIRKLFASIDWIIYNLFSILLQTVFDIANFTLDMGIVDDFVGRIYVIIAIFMTFKIVISLLGYLVNPDSINDKSQGMGKMITRVITSLIMLIMVPTLFNKLVSLQEGVSETLPRLILGTETGYDAENSSSTVISWSVLQAFFYYNEDCGEYKSSTYVNDNGASQSSTQQILEFKSDKDYSDGTSPITIFSEQVNNTCSSNKGKYTYEYMPVISTIAGAFCCYIMIGISVTVAIRMFKLMILKIVAPIPIISYIDPKQAKDGTFNKWIKTLVKTWLDLFINLAILYLVIEVVRQIVTGGFGISEYISDIGFGRGMLFLVFMILALLLFAKQAPKFICDVLGIKNDGGFMQAMGLSTAVLGMGGAAIALGKNNFSEAKGPLGYLEAAGKTLLGGIGSGVAAGSAAIADKGNPKAALDARNKYLSNQFSGNTGLYRAGNSIRNLLLGAEDTSALDNKIRINDDAFSKLKDLKSTAEDKMADNATFRRNITVNGKTYANMNYKELVTNIEGAKNGSGTSIAFLERAGFNSWQDAQVQLSDIKDAFTNEYLAAVKAGGADFDATTFGKMDYAENAAKGAGIDVDLGTLKGVKIGMGKASDASREIKTSEKYQRLHENRK